MAGVLGVLMVGVTVCVSQVVAAEAARNAVPVEVEQGKSTSVMLSSNPSTGFCWSLVGKLPSDSPVEVSLRYAPTEDSTPRCGTPVCTVVEFRGRRPGSETVHLVYRRPWEKNGRSADEAVFIVRVTK